MLRLRQESLLGGASSCVPLVGAVSAVASGAAARQAPASVTDKNLSVQATFSTELTRR